MDKNVAGKGFLNSINEFIAVFLAVFIAVSFGRLLEWAFLLYLHGNDIRDISYVIACISSDFQFSFFAAFPLWLLHAGVKKVLQSGYALFTTAIIVALGLANVLLVIFFSVTLTPLGPEFWAYSFQEMYDTALAAEIISLWRVLIFLSAAGVLYSVIRKLLNLRILQLGDRRLIWIVPFVLFAAAMLPGKYIGNDVPQDFRVNKSAYFLSSSVQTSNWFGFGHSKSEVNGRYPFLHSSDDKDVLGVFFHDIEEEPSIVFLIVESLGGEFTGTNGQWSGFAPFIDSLAMEGLYWENGLSLSGRTFGMMPSLFGSLPPGRNGFMDLGPGYPDHLTLISLLKEQGYHTSFYSGFDVYFDKLDYFLDYQGTDYILSRQKISEHFPSTDREFGTNYWGFDDKTMFRAALTAGSTVETLPRLEIYHTLQSHSPFTVPDPEKYAVKFDSLLTKMNAPEESLAAYRRYRAELTTLLYTDDAIRDFMKSYRKKDHFDNTIFIITGDHWLIPVPQTSRISRYHVPIIIYSPLIKHPVRFESVNTHADIVPTLASFLKQNAGLSLPQQVHWMGSSMDTSRAFRNIHSMPLMKNKNQISDYVDGSFYLSDNNLYRLQPGLWLEEVSDEKQKAELVEKLNRFKVENKYAVDNNKIYPNVDSQHMSDRYRLIAEFDTLFNRIDTTGMSIDEQFQLAREFAFDGKYDAARAISERLLMLDADYHDVRLLLGRTYSWEGLYHKAREIFNSVLQRDPAYADAYNALSDVEYWDGNYESALNVINEGLIHHPGSEQFLEKKIRILIGAKYKSQAQKVFSFFEKQHPENDKLSEFKQDISEINAF